MVYIEIVNKKLEDEENEEAIQDRGTPVESCSSETWEIRDLVV